MNSLFLRRAPLRLIPSTLASAEAERLGHTALGKALGVFVPTSWPPPLTDDTIESAVIELSHAAAFPWHKWYLVLEDDGELRLIGIVGLKGPPVNRTIEIGYSLLETHHRRGLGTRAVALLLDWCESTGWVDLVVAHTLPGLTSSIRVLEKNGFALCGEGAEPGTIKYELSFGNRAQVAQRQLRSER